MRPILLMALLICVGTASAQSTKEQKKAAKLAVIQKAVADRRYLFQARSVNPLGGRSRNLTTPYVLAMKGDTLDVDLPYFGRAYTADISSTDGGIRFRTTTFTYTSTPGKKDGTQVTIVPADQKSASRISLDISSSGYATVQVQSNNRQAISFYGTITQN